MRHYNKPMPEDKYKTFLLSLWSQIHLIGAEMSFKQGNTVTNNNQRRHPRFYSKPPSAHFEVYKKRNVAGRIAKKAPTVFNSPVGVTLARASQVAPKRRASDNRESTAEKRIRREQDKDNAYLVDLIKRLSQKKEEKKTDVVAVSGILALCRANIPTATKESFPTVEELRRYLPRLRRLVGNARRDREVGPFGAQSPSRDPAVELTLLYCAI
ncbi:hypothetical protein QR680_004463 [Steinernema hermaphroditum]|uniref:Uncharacterized protein n=1 Tax=Steinernema hermaphroditum TaxID=289476 RepID=A0AA39HQ69_9BILA|nr:hypothetical protein QR680_004463 [Steinernema hermaphroditum]